MLKIIFFILKICLFVLKIILFLLALLLLLFIIVLISPVKYNFTGEYENEIKINSKITYLYHILGLKADICNEDINIVFLLFGKPLKTSKKDNIFSKKNGKKEVVKDDFIDKQTYEDDVSSANESKSDIDSTEYNGISDESIDINNDILVAHINEDELSYNNKKDLSDATENVEIVETENLSDATENVEIIEAENLSDATENVEIIEADDLLVDNENISDDYSEDNSEYTDNTKDKKSKRDKIEDGVSLIDKLFKMKEILLRPASKKVLKTFLKLIKHLKPKIFKIDAVIGLDNPYYTGKIMEIFSVLYAFYPDTVSVKSDFENHTIKGKVYLKGKIFPGYFIITGVILLFKFIFFKSYKNVYKEIRMLFD